MTTDAGFEMDGGIRGWIEQGSHVCIKAVDAVTGTDPVELTTDEAEHLARELLRLVAWLRERDE